MRYLESDPSTNGKEGFEHEVSRIVRQGLARVGAFSHSSLSLERLG